MVAQTTLQSIRHMPGHYYNLLPSSDRTDMDNDGIPDTIDDSDGDGISDKMDALPYGTNVDIFELRTTGF